MNSSFNMMPASAQSYARAAGLLRGGDLVALPTETVYGLAGDARNADAVARIYATKNRPAHNPLIVHVLRVNDVADFVTLCPVSRALIAAFWPGPLTLVLPKRMDTNLADNASAGLDTLAVRCPNAPWRDAFLDAGFDGPIVMPSANKSGRISPTTAAHVSDDLGAAVSLIIDGGPCPVGVESTIVQITDGRGLMLRPGLVSLTDLQRVEPSIRSHLGDTEKPTAPGQLKSHYAPKTSVRLNLITPDKGDVHLGFGAHFTAPGLNLSPRGDLTEAAHNLFDYLRQLDGDAPIAVAPIPMNGLGAAINDRLKRASAERDE